MEKEITKTRIKNQIQKLIEDFNFEEAERIIIDYMKAVPNDADIYSIYAVLNFYQGELDAAEQILNEGLLFDESNADLLYNKGFILENKNNMALAKYYYSQALKYSHDSKLKNELQEKLGIPNNNNEQPHVLIASPIRQDYAILKEFLGSVSRLNTDGLVLGYIFIDDNVDASSTKLLQDFCLTQKNAVVISSKSDDIYHCDDTHHWNGSLIDKVAIFKNRMIRHAIDDNYDYLFFIDSDIILHPDTLQQLISDQKDIVSNIFWTRWNSNSPEMPQVWQEDAYSLYKTDHKETNREQKKISDTIEFVMKLRTPGVYEVGGLGACTLISRNALLAGVNFTQLNNISFWGEDRHFCIRAASLGFKLFVDTHYPALHIYRKEDLSKVSNFISMGENNELKKICLVINSYSGSNTLALFKMMPEEFRSKYEIRPISQHNIINYVLEVLNSDIVVTTEGNYLLNNKNFKPDQVVVDLWHGFPLKAMGLMDKQDTLKHKVNEQWQNLNYMTSFSQLFNEVMNKCTNIPLDKFVITGNPRNDFLFLSTGRENLEKVLNKSFGNSKLIIFMPTFRYSPRGNRTEGNKNRDNIFGFERFNSDKFNDFLKHNNIHMVVKLHPAEEKKYINTIKELSNIHIIAETHMYEQNLDFYEILNAFDLLITDYSSVYFDYLLLDRPEVFTPVDFKEYENSRGFLLSPYEDWAPGPIAIQQETLEKEIIMQLTEDAYALKRQIVRNKIHKYQDANSTQRVCRILERLLDTQG